MFSPPLSTYTLQNFRYAVDTCILGGRHITFSSREQKKDRVNLSCILVHRYMKRWPSLSAVVDVNIRVEHAWSISRTQIYFLNEEYHFSGHSSWLKIRIYKDLRLSSYYFRITKWLILPFVLSDGLVMMMPYVFQWNYRLDAFMEKKSRFELIKIVEAQKEQLVRYETRLRGKLVQVSRFSYDFNWNGSGVDWHLHLHVLKGYILPHKFKIAFLSRGNRFQPTLIQIWEVNEFWQEVGIEFERIISCFDSFTHGHLIISF